MSDTDPEKKIMIGSESKASITDPEKHTEEDQNDADHRKFRVEYFRYESRVRSYLLSRRWGEGKHTLSDWYCFDIEDEEERNKVMSVCVWNDPRPDSKLIDNLEDEVRQEAIAMLFIRTDGKTTKHRAISTANKNDLANAVSHYRHERRIFQRKYNSQRTAKIIAIVAACTFAVLSLGSAKKEQRITYKDGSVKIIKTRGFAALF